MVSARNLPAFVLPFYGFCAFCVRPKLWKYVLVPGILFWIVVGGFAGFIFTVGLTAQLFLGPLAIPAVIAQFVGFSLTLFILFFNHIQRFIVRAALEEHGVYEQLCMKYGAEKMEEIGCCRRVCHNTCFTITRLVVLWACGVIPTVTIIVPPLALIMLVVLLATYFILQTWNLICESLGRMKLCSFNDQFEFAMAHSCSFLGFGFWATFLETLPVVNIGFMAGNAFGAAVLFEKYFEAEVAREHPRAMLIPKPELT